MQYSTDFIKELEQLSYYVNDRKDAQRSLNWQKVRTYENTKTGFYAESFVNKKGQKVIVFAGTNWKTTSDNWNDIQILSKNVPNQANDAFKAYKNLVDRYGDKSVIVAGYSLGGSLTQIICNETVC